jgi:hypothetical protein
VGAVEDVAAAAAAAAATAGQTRLSLTAHDPRCACCLLASVGRAEPRRAHPSHPCHAARLDDAPCPPFTSHSASIRQPHPSHPCPGRRIVAVGRRAPRWWLEY